mgnify:CR=1 FL=1
MKNVVLSLVIMITGCIAIKPTEYFIGMDLAEFKSKNKGSTLIKNNKNILFFLVKNVKILKNNIIFL